MFFVLNLLFRHQYTGQKARARSRRNILGCKFPFHYAAFLCCRSYRDDCNVYDLRHAQNSATEFNSCMRERRHGDDTKQCWLDAEQKYACGYSMMGIAVMKMLNNGTTW